MARKAAECNVEGCAQRQYKGGVCRDHSAQNYIVNCVEKLSTGEDCDRPVFAKGRCRTHYMRRYRKKQNKAAPPADKPIRSWGGEERYDVFTRISKEAARIIIEASGRPDGMYEKAKEILEAFAKRHRNS